MRFIGRWPHDPPRCRQDQREHNEAEPHRWPDARLAGLGALGRQHAGPLVTSAANAVDIYCIHKLGMGGHLVRFSRRTGLQLMLGVLRAVLPSAGFAQTPFAPNTFYVSPAGNNSNPGTSALPFQTIAGAQTAVPTLGAGYTLILKSGTYTENVVITKGGSPVAPFTVKAEVRGAALIRPTGGYSAFVIQKDYVTVDGLDVQGGGTGHGIEATWLDGVSGTRGPHHINIKYCTSHGNAISGMSVAYGDRYTIEYCVAYGNCHTCPQGIQGSGISIYQPRAADAVAGIHNIIHSCRSYGNVINRLTNGVGGAVFGGYPASEPDHTDANGIILDDFRNTQNNSRAGIFPYTTLVENNVCYGNGNRGIHAFFSNNCMIKNNTCYHNNQDLCSLATWRSELSNAYGSNNLWANNIGVTDTPSITTLIPRSKQRLEQRSATTISRRMGTRARRSITT